MNKKLLIGVLGNYRSGKSRTWQTLFNKKVKTGKHNRLLTIYDCEIPVFLINVSPLERNVDIKYILPNEEPTIVLCSFLYHKNIKNNFNYFIDNNYDMYIQWLNPGYSDSNDKVLFYNVGIINYLLSFGATVTIKNAKIDCNQRVKEIKNYIYAWNLGNYK